MGVSSQDNDTKLLGVIIIIIFIFFAFNILRLWLIFLPQMEEAGRETERLVSGNDAISIINTNIIPEIRLFFILTLLVFGILDGVFSLMLWKGKPREEHRMLIMPLFIIYLIGRILSGIIISIFIIFVIIGSNPRNQMNSLYMITLIFSALGIVIICIFYDKIFSPRKRTATKILVGRSEKSTP
jgi:hypothetical protein